MFYKGKNPKELSDLQVKYCKLPVIGMLSSEFKQHFAQEVNIDSQTELVSIV